MRNIDTERCVSARGGRFAVKGVVALPAGMEDIGRVADVWPAAEVERIEVNDGAATVSGRVRLAVMYISKDGGTYGFVSETAFEHTVTCEGLSENMNVAARVTCGRESHRVADGTSIDVEAELTCTLIASENAKTEVWDDDAKDIYIKEAAFPVPELIDIKTVKARAKTELSAEGASDVLSSWGEAVITRITKEAGSCAVEAELTLFIVLAAEGGEKVIAKKAPFGAVIDLTGFDGDCEAAIDLDVERVGAHMISAETAEAAAQIAVTCHAVRIREERAACDAFSSACELTPQLLDIPLSFESRGQTEVHTVTMKAAIPDGYAPAASVLFARGRASVDKTETEGGSAYASGTIEVSLCYKAEEAGIRNAVLKLPFRERAGAAAAGSSQRAWASVISAECSGSGRDIDIRCELALCTHNEKITTVTIMSGAERGAQRQKRKSGVTVIEKGGDLWEVSKQMGTSPADAVIKNGHIRLIRR